MARSLYDVADIDSIRYDDVSFDGEQGHVGVTLFMPSARQITLRGAPDLVVPYSAGWGEGKQAADVACQALTKAANVMTVSVTYPRKSLDVSEIVPFRTAVFAEVIDHLHEHSHYDHYDKVVVGYSRGTAPARRAAVQMHDRISGIALIAPTWFKAGVKPIELAQKGIAESVKGARRGSWLDRMGLVGATVRLATELVAHPLELRKDVSAIAEDGAVDLVELLGTGLNVSVIAGRDDEVCSIDGIQHVLDQLAEDGEDIERIDYREVDSDHFSYFLNPTPLRAIADQVLRLAGMDEAADQLP